MDRPVALRITQQDVERLDVSVDDPHRVQVGQTQRDLCEQHPDFLVGNRLALAVVDVGRQVAVRGELHYDVQKPALQEAVQVFDDERGVDLWEIHRSVD